MKILYLHQYFVPPDAPGGTRSYEFARRLVERGHQVTMVTSSAVMKPGTTFADRITRCELAGIELVVLPVAYGNAMSYAQRIHAFAKFAASASAEAVRHRPDVVFATSTPLTIAIPGLLARIVRAVPMVFEVRDLWPELAGSGAEEAATAARAREAGVLGRNLWMLPPLPKREMPAFLGCATVATSLFMPVPEMWNNSANKFFDALAAGKPVAINYGGWQAELLRTSGAGISLPQGAPDQAARELAALVRSPAAIAEASASARELARRRFDRDVLAVELESVLQRAIARHAGGAVTAGVGRSAA